jgi:MFS family permease
MGDSVSTSDGIETTWEPVKPNTWRLARDMAYITPQVIDFKLKGSGSSLDPYLVEWVPNDPRNPMNFSFARKWVIAGLTAISIFVISFSSSAYTGGIVQISEQFEVSHTIALLGVSMFVLGFALGPLIWAPLCEIYGRRIICLITYAGATIFGAACIGAQSATQIIILRLIAGIFGSATLTNSGGVMADMFNNEDRGQAMSIFACARMVTRFQTFPCILLTFLQRSWAQSSAQS